jgi:hypothetical protein
VALEPGVLAVRHLREALARPIAERLTLLRGVDPVDADLVLLLLGVEHSDGVAVGDAHDTAFHHPSGSLSSPSSQR